MLRRHKRWAVGVLSVTFALVVAGVPLWDAGQKFRQAQATHALAVAVYHDDTKAALAALQSGADPNTRWTVDSKPPTLAQFMRQFWQQARGAKAATTPETEPHPPMIALAAERQNLAVVQALLAKGATPDRHSRDDAADVDFYFDDVTEGETALMWAAKNNNVAIAKALLAKGANPNFNAAGWGEAPLLETTAPVVMETLLAYGADIHAEVKHSKFVGITPLRYVVLKFAGYEEDVTREERQRFHQCVETLLAHGADINENNYRHKGKEESGYDRTVMLMVAQYGAPADVRYLLAKGANPHISNQDGWNALAFAIEDGRTENIRVLLEHGMNPNKRYKDGSTPLFEAVEHGEDGPAGAH